MKEPLEDQKTIEYEKTKKAILEYQDYIRTDESQSNAFKAQEKIAETHYKIEGLLNHPSEKNIELVGHLIKKMNKELQQARNFPLAIESINLAFGEGSLFDRWRNGLSQDQEKTLTPYLLHQHPIITTSPNFMTEFSSQWSRSHTSPTTRVIEEIIRSEIVGIHTMQPLYIVFNKYLTSPQVENSDKMQVRECLKKLNKVKESFQALNLAQLFNPPPKNTDELITKLAALYQGPEFKNYSASMMALGIDNTLEKLEQKYDVNTRAQIGLGNSTMAQYLIPASQRMTRLPLFFKTLNKSLGDQYNFDLDSALGHILKTAARAEAKNYVKDQAHIKDQSKNKTLLTYLAISENEQKIYEPGPFSDDASIIYKSTYLQSLLIRTYPQYFSESENGELQASNRIKLALGIDVRKSTSTGEIVPAHFNIQMLNSLYQQDKNPLWQILKMIKPIGSDYSVEDKLQSHLEVIKAIQAGQLNLDHKQTPVEQSRVIAQQALSILQAAEKENKKLTGESLYNNPVIKTILQEIHKNIRSTWAESAQKKFMRVMGYKSEKDVRSDYKEVTQSMKDDLQKTRERSDSFDSDVSDKTEKTAETSDTETPPNSPSPRKKGL